MASHLIQKRDLRGVRSRTEGSRIEPVHAEQMLVPRLCSCCLWDTRSRKGKECFRGT